MRSDRKKQVMTLSILLVAVLVISIGFAAFSRKFEFEPTLTVNPDSRAFSVKFSKTDSIPATSGTVTPTISPSTETANLSKEIVASNATIDGATTLSGLYATLISPGDSVQYWLYVVNEGKYDAYLSDIQIGSISCTPGEGATESLVKEACKGIQVQAQIGGRTYDSSTPSITNNKLYESSVAVLIITLKYNSNAARADGPFTVDIGDISLYYSTKSGDVPPPKLPCHLTDDDNVISVGDEVVCDSESFYVIPNDSTAHPTAIGDNITLLTKYNLDAGYIKESSAYTPIENPTGLQSPQALGWVSTGTPYYGTSKFSTTNYWGSITGDVFVYNNQSLLYTYVENYKTLVQSMGVDVKEASLASKTQFNTFKTSNLPSDFTITSFWLGTASDASKIYRVLNNGVGGYDYKSDYYGVRPIIVIPKSDVDVS